MTSNERGNAIRLLFKWTQELCPQDRVLSELLNIRQAKAKRLADIRNDEVKCMKEINALTKQIDQYYEDFI